ncbi:MAG: hypothetical protein J7539_00180 [Niabella sp.]|nr:hypothetical protein [Niabella sp.]
MKTVTIKEELHNYLEIADDKKLKAIYIMVEDEIKEAVVTYTDDFKIELDKRLDHYLKGEKMVTPNQMNKRLKAIRKKKG